MEVRALGRILLISRLMSEKNAERANDLVGNEIRVRML